MILYTIGTQVTYDEYLCTVGEMMVNKGKYAWNTPEEALAFIREEREPWHAWCGVYMMVVQTYRKDGAVTEAKKGKPPVLLPKVSGAVVRRIWPSRHSILRGATL